MTGRQLTIESSRGFADKLVGRRDVMRLPTIDHLVHHTIPLRAALIAVCALIAVVAGGGCQTSRCFPDCVEGYEPVPDACGCRLVADAASDRDFDAADASTSARKKVFHLLNGALGAIRDANDTRMGLEVADAKCTTAGQMHGGGQWRAWLSSSSVNAIDRLADVGPWYRLDQQTKLFDNLAAITQGPLVRIEEPSDTLVDTRNLFWTGTLLDGTASTANCTDWTDYVGVMATAGRVDTAGPGWVAPTLQSCSTYLSLLCFEQ